MVMADSLCLVWSVLLADACVRMVNRPSARQPGNGRSLARVRHAYEGYGRMPPLRPGACIDGHWKMEAVSTRLNP